MLRIESFIFLQLVFLPQLAAFPFFDLLFFALDRPFFLLEAVRFLFIYFFKQLKSELHIHLITLPVSLYS